MKIGFIGCGNMGGALARAVLKNKQTKVYISDFFTEKAESFAKETGAVATDNFDIAENCDFIFLAVKPANFPATLEPLKESFTKNPGSVIVTIAAGLSLEKVGAMIGSAHSIIRIMPNTPVLLGKGMITWCKNSSVTDEQREEFLKILQFAGRLDEIDEKLIDAASAVAGCGPAFVYMFIEALADGAVECGLPRDKAMAYAAETLIGAAEMVLKTGKHPGLLKDEVCSPGGSTIEGVKALEDAKFRAATASAVIAACEKTKKLGK
ncbi:MAG: pyrroline-5-carboxylate reductase [Ruminococcaceae bacterium]|nr:pyrroline-5-carboxylate reductase [Oscillospiraceae bacterium]